jgi:two-component system nitrogen regulation sensor histidine kinase NtrY
MPFSGDPRRRSVALLAGGVLLFFALLGALQAFNTSSVRFLNPETSGETLIFTGLTVLVFLLLLVLLMLLLRNILKLYVGQSSSALGARLRTRMVLGAALIALTPAVFMFLFSFNLMNRSIDRWFSPNTSELREDSTRVVLELAQYVTDNARVEAESIAASGALDKELPHLQDELSSHRITLGGGFAVVYGKDLHEIASFQAPPESSQASLLPWLPEKNDAETWAQPFRLHGPLSANPALRAQRGDEAVFKVGGQEYALGMSATASGKVVVVALPMPKGLEPDGDPHPRRRDEYWQLFRSRNRIRTTFIPAAAADHGVRLLLQRVAGAVFVQADYAAGGGAGRRHGRDCGRQVRPSRGGDCHRRDGRPGARLQPHGGRPGNQPPLAESSSAQLTAANQAIEERRRELETIVETIPSGVVTLDGSGVGAAIQSRLCGADGPARRREPGRGAHRVAAAGRVLEDLAGVIRRGQRMGAASTEIEMHARGRTIHLAVTSARLELAHGQHGTVLVVEDMTELLRAQRQLAWKEVAQRVAHEIKNPLTPIALSAERIGSIWIAASRLAAGHSQVQRGDSGLRGYAAHAGRPVLRAGAVSRAAAARLRYESRGRGGAGAVCRPARRHHGAVGSGAGLPPVLADPEAFAAPWPT